MTLSPNVSLSPQPGSRVLLGVIIDVSDSMRESWRNKDGKRLPRIEIIRETLNRKIKEEQQRCRIQKDTLGSIDMFCLGLGFRYPIDINRIISTTQQSLPKGKNSRVELTDLICDLLALNEMLPSQEKQIDFKERLDQKWRQCTESILDQSMIAENVFAQLVEYLQEGLYDSAMHKYHQGLLYNLSRQEFVHGFHWFSQLLTVQVANMEEYITTTSQVASAQYADEIFKKINRDFTKNKAKYTSLIQRHLEEFVQSYTASTLQAFTLGFTAAEIVDDLDEKRAFSIATQIYRELDADVRQSIKLVLAIHIQKLLSAQQRISAKIDIKEVKRLTERFIQKFGWDILKPHIETTVYDMFAQHFDGQAKESFSDWIRLASTREVIRPLTTLSNILPDVVEGHVYSEAVMFGSTPFRQALD